MDGIDGDKAIFDDWAASDPGPRTFEFFNKDFVPRSILDFVEDDCQSSSITMEFEKKKPPISFEEGGKKMGFDWTSDDSSELIQFNVQKSGLRGVHNERMAEMARSNLLKVIMSESDKEKIMFEVDSSESGTKYLISSLPEECSSSMSLSPGFSHTLTESLDYFSISTALPNSNASLQENLNHLEPSGRIENTHDIVADKKTSHFLDVNESPPPPPPPPPPPRPPDDHQIGEKGVEVESSSAPETDPAKDGYNWRKYGQKQLKGCEFPCSYHKCTHPNCPVKKKIERSLQGHITEIIYKGYHNHPKPPPNHRSRIPSSKKLRGPQSHSSDHPGPGANVNGNSSWASIQDGLGGTSSASLTEFGDPSYFLNCSQSDLLETMESSCAISNDKKDNEATHGSFSIDCGIEEEEMESKRRNQELCPVSKSAASRAMRDHRIVVQIPSEVDIPNDGYRWRKYGQKVVKGNPNPRSYYKCTNRGCSVRKHVERASDDPKSVISTYEGKHNHDVPSARITNRARYSPSSSTSTAAVQLSSLYPRPELAQDSFMRLESRVPISAFGLLGRGHQLGAATGFSFGFDQSNLVSLWPFGSGSMGPFKVPYFSTIHQSMDRHQQVDCGNIMQMRELKNEPM